MNNKFSLGIDTSNYKTSIAVVDSNGIIIENYQQFLQIKKGERGLRQSTALFQHVNNLPLILEKILLDPNIRGFIGCVSVSTKPRPLADSYMPVFNSGTSVARILAAALNVPLFKFSHQEGHIEAIKHYSTLKNLSKIICYHFSGGTTEALLVNKGEINIIGGTKDISFGQVLDRVGVALNFDFPSGEKMDEIAQFEIIKELKQENIFTPIKVEDCYFNLSGLETQCQRVIENLTTKKIPIKIIIEDIFETIAKAIISLTKQICSQYSIYDFLFVGGVSSSEYIRNYIKKNLPKEINIVFGNKELSTDNAVGVALLGGNKIWQ